MNRRPIKVLGIVCLIMFIILGGVGFYLYRRYYPEVRQLTKTAYQKVDSITPTTFKSRDKTVIYDSNGKVLDKLAPIDYSYINFADIKPPIINATISIEDSRFFQHRGYDLWSYFRVAYETVMNKGKIVEGGSTITQQLAKNVFLTESHTWQRKYEEFIIANELEKKFSKDQILEFYLNNINYANGAYSIESASETYFNKPCKNLTLSEIAFLVGIPNNPTFYDPFRHFNNTLSRRNLVLTDMKNLGKITDQQFQKAINQKIILNPKPKKPYVPESYAVSFAISETVKDLMNQQGFQFKYSFATDKERNAYTQSYADLYQQLDEKVRQGGYLIYTSLDTNKQNTLQQSVNQGLQCFTVVTQFSWRWRTHRRRRQSQSCKKAGNLTIKAEKPSLVN